jgi:integrase/recombinase XerD
MLEDLQIRHYSPTTIRLYLHSVAEFARYFHKPPDQLGPEHIRQYQLFLIKEKKASQSTCIQLVCALRFLYTHTLNRKIEIERIPFPRRERKLPLILSREEVKALLEAPAKLRDRAALAVLYGSGLRIAEVTQLKPDDIDARRNVLWVRQGKGRKDRQTLLPAKLLELLRLYWRAERPGDWIFPGADGTRPVGPKTIYHACRAAGKAAAIRRPVHPHLLRHYAASRTMPRISASAAIHGYVNDSAAA